MGKKVVIIGGGIVGLCSAYYLVKEGCEVTVIDKSNFTSGASYVNAGYVAPSHIIPLAAPGIISKGLRWMLDSTSPFYVKPRLDSQFFRWGYAFYRSSTQKNVEKAIPVIKDINLFSRDLYEGIKNEGEIAFHYERKGLLMAYQSEKVGEEEWEVGKRAIKEGLKVEHLSREELKSLEKKVELNVKGAVYFHSDAHMTPTDFMRDLLQYLKNKGVEILREEEVLDIDVEGGKIQHVKTEKRILTADDFVFSAGSWSAQLAQKLKINMLLEAGKGYRIDVKEPTEISIPTILCEAKVAITPMDGFTRLAGTMELGGINHNISPVRVNAIADAAQNYYPNLKITEEQKSNAKCGLRPVTPDGLPYIGKSKKCKNAIFATGHAMMGWSLGPVTGKLVSEIVNDKKSSLDIQPFHPDRKF